MKAMRVIQGEGTKGSKKWLQKLINEKPKLLDKQILNHLDPKETKSITWLAPKEKDGYAEYSDEDSLNLLGITLDKRPLESFWPSRGPQWDGLGKSDSGNYLFVEAKSHISELYSCTGAKGKSLELILNSLNETKEYLNPNSKVDWSNGFYQYANRLAHLLLIRKLNGKPAYLVFVYFLNDSEMGGPSSVNEWKGAIELLHAYFGLKRHKLQRYVIDVFVDITEL
jgi:hypothetical protein